jgi:hypothetical protein
MQCVRNDPVIDCITVGMRSTGATANGLATTNRERLAPEHLLAPSVAIKPE